jgi:hypothetical protein
VAEQVHVTAQHQRRLEEEREELQQLLVAHKEEAVGQQAALGKAQAHHGKVLERHSTQVADLEATVVDLEARMLLAMRSWVAASTTGLANRPTY